MRKYETLFIVRPDKDSAAVDDVINRVKGYVEQEGGNVLKVTNLQKKRTAYEVKKHKEGVYVQFNYDAPPELPRKLERFFELSDDVIRYLTIVDDEGRYLDAAEKGLPEAYLSAEAYAADEDGYAGRRHMGRDIEIDEPEDDEVEIEDVEEIGEDDVEEEGGAEERA